MTEEPGGPSTDLLASAKALARVKAAFRYERALEADALRAREATREVLQDIGDLVRAPDSSLSWSDVAEVAGVSPAMLMRRAKTDDSAQARLAASRARQAKTEAGRVVGSHDALSVTAAATIVGVARLTMHRWLAAGTHGYTRDQDGRVLPPPEGWPVPREGKMLAADTPATVREAAKRLGRKRAEVLEMIDRGELTTNDVGLVNPPAGGWPVPAGAPAES